MSKATDTDRVLRMLRQLMETKRDNPSEEVPDDHSGRMYLAGRRDAFGEVIRAITETLGE